MSLPNISAEITSPPMSSPPSMECRIYERTPCALPSTCQPASVSEMNELRWSATITDISPGGVRLVLKRRFEKGTALAVELPGTEKRPPTVVFVKVVHVKAHEGGWVLGCKLVSELGEDELRNLLTATTFFLASEQEPSSPEAEINVE